MSEPIETLGDALPKEMARVRDELMPRYLAIGVPGMFTLSMMRNPDHLFLGTNKDNIDDRVRKGRSPRANAKLSEDQVLEIRAECSKKPDELAVQYGISPATVYYIKTRRSWRHL